MPEKMKPRHGEGTILIPAPLEVDALMRQVPAGKLTTVNQLRAVLAERHGATVSCPMTTGILISIAAHAAAEDEAAGEADVTPFWRTLKSGGEINPKYPGSLEGSIRRLESEGHTVTRRGKRMFVQDYERHLAWAEH